VDANRGLLLVLIALPVGCGGIRPVEGATSDAQGVVISGEEIRESGATDAWDALQRIGNHLSLRETRSGVPVGMRRRGAGSMLLNNSPLIVLDGTPLVDMKVLRRIPARLIAEIRILNGPEAGWRYGTGSANGAVVVTTLATPNRDLRID
jgi:hypothetical protein